MPIFSDIIYLESIENEFELLKEFNFKLSAKEEVYKGYNLRINSKSQLEFDSNDSVYKIPRQYLVSGDKITIDDLKGNSYDFKVINREFRKVKEDDFENSKLNSDTSQLKSIDCDLRFTDEEMQWILVGTAPVDMSDRIVMFSKENIIKIFSSWGGQLFYCAKYERLDKENYVVNNLKVAIRAIEMTDKEYIDKFRFQLEYHLDDLNWINKCSTENYIKV